MSTEQTKKKEGEAKANESGFTDDLLHVKDDELLVVGIGASAGGIQALKTFFANVPRNTGIAYVVVLHISPDHESKLAEVLQTDSVIPVTQVNGVVKVESDQVYVVAPNQGLAMTDGHLDVRQLSGMDERRAPIDMFFRTLAESHHDRAVCVILSGSGADGSMGLKRVKERGGAAFVQNPREAEFSEMPRNAIATNLVDAIMPAAEIPAKIAAYKRSIETVQITETEETEAEDQQHSLRDILTQLRIRTGHDFSNYKRGTLLRRIARRINVHGLSGLQEYAAYIRENPEEATALLKDLLISVTNFFRDKEAFDAFGEQVLSRIVSSKSASDQIRVWSVGCATGEEAYSIAMMLAELTGKPGRPGVQVFATDIDDTAIAQAREGFYTLNDAADVSPERLRRFFTQEPNGYRIRREIREMVLFANHNILKDPPFARLDLATCRNVLIYLNQQAQARALETLHFALKPGGFLFIGPSESIEASGDLYAPVSREFHIFQARHASTRIAYPLPHPFNINRLKIPELPEMPTKEQEQSALERLSYADLHRALLELYAPPSVVVNERYDIVHLSESAGKYLRLSGGSATLNLLKVIREELRLELRTSLYQATQRHTNVVSREVTVGTNGSSETVNIQVRPVLNSTDTARGFLLVLFEPVATKAKPETAYRSDEPLTRQLEDELERTKQHLRTSSEQFEAQAEELKASNEGLQAMNEELRSSAEELEASKEELQSVNEELITVNQELKIKIEELSQSNNDFRNLINSTDIATLFLDRSLRINHFSPSARQIFNLLESDLGRPLSDLHSRLEYKELHADAESVFETLQMVERDIQSSDGKTYLMQMTPYRTAEDRINGVVLALFDITKRVAAEHALRTSHAEVSKILESISDAFCAVDPEGEFTYVNRRAEQFWGRNRAELVGRSIWKVIPEAEEAELYSKLQNAARGVGEQKFEAFSNKLERWVDVSVYPASGGMSIYFRDITERKRREENLAFLAEINSDLAVGE
jgi:two-component system CheB/CheR fusion protein